MRQARRLRGPRLQTKRAYEAAARSDGYRVLVDRLWPRGVEKDALALDAWAKDLAPSSELRRWFGHDPSRWKKFVERYRLELRAPAARERLDDLARRAAKGAVTVVYGARDEQHNDAAVVRGVIARRLRRRPVRSARRGAA
ncbi:MAG: DUF488 domain-containing protein [Gemmatimonadales bacterium]